MNAQITLVAIALETELRANGITQRAVDLGSELFALKGKQGPLHSCLKVGLRSRLIGKRPSRSMLHEVAGLRIFFGDKAQQERIALRTSQAA